MAQNQRFPNTRQLPSGRWGWRKTLHINGEKIKASSAGITFGSSESAYRNMIAEIEHAKRHGIDHPQQKPTPTFGELADEWIATVVPETCKSTDDYQGILDNHVLPAFADTPVTQITRKTIKGFLLQKRRDGLAKSTVTHHKNCISGVLMLAVEDEILQANPALQLGRLWKPEPTGKKVFPFEPDELAVLLQAFENHKSWYHPLVLTLARTGMRFGEAAALQREDIDLENRIVHVRGSYSRGRLSDTTKTGDSRRVDLSQQTAKTLGVWLTRVKRETLARGWKTVPQWVFVNSKGDIIDINIWRRRHWNPIFKLAEMKEIEARPLKQTRHTYITHRLRKGDDIWDIAKQVGHKTTRMIETVYAHWIPGTRKDQVDELDTLAQDSSLPPNATGHPKKKPRGQLEVSQPLDLTTLSLAVPTGLEPVSSA